ncbi:hypothetical protein V5799_021828 [Amblyomma americanum]|uniref:Uncharacterized protein n=1 Tax=Amblyomma americanum TaxID=6943 RepID=A0AAQ4FM91_AMBAM
MDYQTRTLKVAPRPSMTHLQTLQRQLMDYQTRTLEVAPRPSMTHLQTLQRQIMDYQARTLEVALRPSMTHLQTLQGHPLNAAQQGKMMTSSTPELKSPPTHAF